jgi:hypothetical protein
MTDPMPRWLMGLTAGFAPAYHIFVDVPELFGSLTGFW